MLDSGHGSEFAGRFDVFSAAPHITLTTRGSITEIREKDHTELSRADPLTLLRMCLSPGAEGIGDLPFSGGAIGYFGYDLGRRYERVDGPAHDDIGMPDMAVGIYDWAVVVDHKIKKSWLVGQGRDNSTFEQWDQLLQMVNADAQQSFTVDPFEVLSEISSNLSEAQYSDAFSAIAEHIRVGNCYQVNLTQRFQATVRGSSWDAYLALRKKNPAPYSAYMSIPDGDILCSSPERFLQITGGHVETKPIKGTRPRSNDPICDLHLAEELRNSTKDRAENVMIVDLLRNDLGKCCVPGSVNVAQLFSIESYASVHHLVSTVHGTLTPDCDAFGLLRACFPGGSITGAPKVAAMKIIDDVEPQRRGVYCGSIAYVGFDGNMDSNIAIRTLVRKGHSIYAWAGGGVVADSSLASEYQESFDKAAAMLSILTQPVAAI
jgi:para-aminobenzoate synthetase component 1